MPSDQPVEQPDTSDLPRCPKCVEASEAAAERKAERDAAAICR